MGRVVGSSEGYLLVPTTYSIDIIVWTCVSQAFLNLIIMTWPVPVLLSCPYKFCFHTPGEICKTLLKGGGGGGGGRRLIP